jgi:DNA modification methylase
MATPGDHRVEGRKGSLALIPARFALACLDAHWIVRSEIVWSKVRFIPDHSTMRRPQRSHETIYQLTRRTDTFVAEVDDPGRSVWTIAPEPLMVPEWADHHAAAMPTEMARRIIERWSAPGDLVLDPFAGAGTTGLVASVLGRKYALIDLNPRYVELAEWRIGDATERKKVRKRHARIVTEKGISVIPRCGVCGVDISHRRLGSRTCSDACRAKAYRDR